LLRVVLIAVDHGLVHDIGGAQSIVDVSGSCTSPANSGRQGLHSTGERSRILDFMVNTSVETLSQLVTGVLCCHSPSCLVA